jgi:DNA-binding NarL/FixJ family response regulator
MSKEDAPNQIRVVIADDHTILRVGLRAFLRYHGDIAVVGEAQDGAGAVARVEELHPDVVLMDIAMPGMNGIEATRQIRERFPGTRVLVLTQYKDPQYILPLLRAGASGYLLKDALGAELLTALRAVAKGETLLDSTVSSMLTAEIRGTGADKGEWPEPLTPRESQILRQITLGQTCAQIAKTLSISVNTVEWHRANLMSKMGVHTAGELVSHAMRQGIM